MSGATDLELHLSNGLGQVSALLLLPPDPVVTARCAGSQARYSAEAPPFRLPGLVPVIDRGPRYRGTGFPWAFRPTSPVGIPTDTVD